MRKYDNGKYRGKTQGNKYLKNLSGAQLQNINHQWNEFRFIMASLTKMYRLLNAKTSTYDALSLHSMAAKPNSTVKSNDY